MSTFQRKSPPVHFVEDSCNDSISSTGFSRRRMKVGRAIRLRTIFPAIIGISLGFALSMFYIPVVEQRCMYDLEESQILIFDQQQRSRLSDSHNENSAVSNDKNADNQHREPVVHTTVRPRVAHFAYGLRSFYITSELGYRDKVLVGVLTSRENLESLVFAINNTWASALPKIIFFTPLSRDVEFHEKYNKVLGLPVVQLSDVDEEVFSKTKMSFKMLRYMNDHYINNFEWFMRVDDSLYMKPEKLIEFLNTVNSSDYLYIGRPAAFKAEELVSNVDLYRHQRYCEGGTGVLLSRSTLQKLAPKLDSCLEDSLSDVEDMELGRCLFKHVGVQCTWSYEASDMFYQISKEQQSNIVALAKNHKLSHAITVSPVTDTHDMYEMHRYYTELQLNKTFVDTRAFQTAIKDMLPYLPDEVPEKKPSWPIGFQPPFRPKSRFEVIQWEYFTDSHTYGFTETNPEVVLRGAYKADIEEVKDTAIKMLAREYGHNKKIARLINGYRRLDPRRGAEYILDLELTGPGSSVDGVQRRRVHLLRPYTKVESLQTPSVSQQRGIHVVLPVTRQDTALLERFLQVYQRVCLQTGENVVLLTVFVNVRDGTDAANTREKFGEAKALITRYKQKYSWAQLPWIQIGVKYNSLTLLMDIVTMKLPSNALIFLTSVRVEFSVDFLNRCRVNALGGEQVFFPIPFSYYDTKLVYQNSRVPDEVPLHRDTGHWDQRMQELACFNNKDYKNNRLHTDSFLKEEEYHPRDLMRVFLDSPLHVFIAVDINLRQRYRSQTCDPRRSEADYSDCLAGKAEGMASRSQLALLMFEQNRKREAASRTTS